MLMPYSQRSPGSNAGRLQRRVLAADDPRKVSEFHIFGGIGIPEVVCEPSGVGQQVTQRYRALGRPQFRFALVIESFQYLRRRQVGQYFADRLVKLELALLHELHRRSSGQSLGHRRDPEHRVHRHIGALSEIALAERALVNDAIVVCRYRDDARNLLRVRGLA